MNRDRVTGLISVVVGAALAAATLMLPASTMRGDVGPKVFPSICAAIFLICGAGMLLQKTEAAAGKQYTSEALKRLGIIAGIVLLYVIAMDLIGFMIPSIAVLFVLCTMFSEDLQIPLWKRLLFAVIVSVVIYYAFEKLMVLRLPRGRFF
ncbi:MAG: tripartite tricarboxylate transporter TctB family protein [Lachnospiraceae bacterium]|nr:tripartite tricarboxylate transporter TctB family protein [Lachnospiraceae bacterium]